MLRLGVHVSIAGKIYEAVNRAEALGCNTMQIFSRNPRGWQVSALAEEDARKFRKLRREKGVKPCFIHIPYLINLTTPDEKLWQKSIRAYIDDIKRADALGAEYFVTHLGSHKGKGEDFGVKRFSSAINAILTEAKPALTLLLETTSGAGDSLGGRLENLSGIISRIKETNKIGVCLDTCHLYAAGYNIADKKGLDETLSKIDREIGLKRVKLIHLNDSRGEINSKLDRHEHIGKGKIGLKGFRFIINHPGLRNVPFILETPKNGPECDPMNLKIVKGLYKECV
ncbi:MAG: deoxyribonuclease IV [Candidatus Omnitrophica bacterium]|nr:deoxyribonuclease IV [Candidatus Omnitrophota bacterium]